VNNDPADLSHLADIMVPPPVPWWPPAPGWWILAAAALVASALLAWIALRRHRRNAYRRAALAELAAGGALANPTNAATVSAVLKRATLVAYPRAEVASLTGSAWLAFLDRTGSTRDFTDGPAAALALAVGGRVGDGAAILAASRRWVRRHRGED
jgi:hypothetical protein